MLKMRRLRMTFRTGLKNLIDFRRVGQAPWGRAKIGEYLFDGYGGFGYCDGAKTSRDCKEQGVIRKAVQWHRLQDQDRNKR
jgi:hypothetical protein